MNAETELERLTARASLDEAARLMTVCNSCRYCEGLCAVFPAMELRRSYPDGDLNYLASLCHSCGACYVDCQFSSPHEFDVNVPKVLAKVRGDSYATYAWPGALAPLFQRNGLVISIIAALSVAAFILGFVGWSDPSILWASHTGPGAFYKVMPHNTMVALFGSVFVFAILAMALSVRNFWRNANKAIKVNSSLSALWQAAKDAGRLHYLDGGGVGCYGPDEKPTDNRRHYHHMTFYGFLLCFAATSVGTLYHYLLGYEAPYPWYDLPVVLGTLGGVGLIIGPIGLIRAKHSRDPAMVDKTHLGMDAAFLMMLLATSVTGLALLFLRETSLMSILLAVHLGVVFALFLTLPYSRFVHGLYRFAALVRYAAESKQSH